jgi:hypothetical protein
MPLAPFTPGDEMIDSRDIIERIELLQSDDERDEGGTEELHQLVELADEGAAYAEDWQYGETLILDSYFVEYTREMVEDCGYFSHDYQGGPYSAGHHEIDWNAWPYRCIDWERVADEMKADYTTIMFGGCTYWIRSV